MGLVPEPAQADATYQPKYLPVKGMKIHQFMAKTQDRSLRAYNLLITQAAKTGVYGEKKLNYARFMDLSYGLGLANADPDVSTNNKLAGALSEVLDKNDLYGGEMVEQSLRKLYPDRSMDQVEFDNLVVAYLSQNRPDLALDMILKADTWIKADDAERDPVSDALSRFIPTSSAYKDKGSFVVTADFFAEGDEVDEGKKKDFYRLMIKRFNKVNTPELKNKAMSGFKLVYEDSRCLGMGEGEFKRNFDDWIPKTTSAN